jgi:acyl carrier protein
MTDISQRAAFSVMQLRDLMRDIPSWSRIETQMRDDDSFSEAGADSLAFLELVAELQRLTGLEFPDDDIERISTIAGVVRYVHEKAR